MLHLVSAVDYVPSVAAVLFYNKQVIYIKIVSVQSTYSLLIVPLNYRMWHCKLERHGELGLGGSSWSNNDLEGLSLCFDSLVSKNGNVLVELHV